jgi:TolA-binding protein
MRTVMKKTVFVVYSLILFSCFLESYFYFRFHFSGVDQLQVKVTQLEAGVEQERLRTLLAQSELLEYQEQIATLMPDVLKKTGMPSKENYELRSLASVVEKNSGSGLQIEKSSSLLEAGKKEFREKQFDDSADTFRKLLRQYPDSTHAIEANFLLTESLFQMKDFEACIEVIDGMMDLYPDSDLTGFAILRLGKIYENQDRIEDAIEMYKAVLKNYTDKSLVQQAQANLKAVAL